MAESYVVTAPLVIVKDKTGASHYHYQFAVLPSYVTKSDLNRLEADGLIAKVDAPEEVVEAIVPPPADQPPADAPSRTAGPSGRVRT